ncbi:MAG: hypothetical protein WCI05_03100 [Myxococcales bacterium]
MSCTIQRQAQLAMVGGVFGFRVDDDRTTQLARLRFGEIDDLLTRDDFVLAVVLRRPFGIGGESPQRLDFRQREIVRKPSGLLLTVDGPVHTLPNGKLAMTGDVRAYGQIRIMPSDQHAIFRRDEIEFDGVGPHVDGELVSLQGFFGKAARGASMRQHHGLCFCKRPEGLVVSATAGGQDDNCDERPGHRVVLLKRLGDPMAIRRERNVAASTRWAQHCEASGRRIAFLRRGQGIATPASRVTHPLPTLG